MSRYRTPLKEVLGLGSAKTGTAHFVAQRLTATALVVLGIWFLVFVLGLLGADYVTATAAVATGIALLKMVDPKLKSGTLNEYGVAYVGFGPFEIGMTILAPIAVILLVIALLLVVVGIVIASLLRRRRRLLAALPAPWLLKPIRLMSARSGMRRNSRGRGLPSCARAVTVPTSTCPNPRAVRRTRRSVPAPTMVIGR